MSDVKSNITCMSPPIGLAAYYQVNVEPSEDDINNGFTDSVRDVVKCPVASLVYTEVGGVIKEHVFVFDAHVIDSRNKSIMLADNVIGGSLLSIGLKDGLLYG